MNRNEKERIMKVKEALKTVMLSMKYFNPIALRLAILSVLGLM